MRVYLDTAPTIYLVENISPWAEAVSRYLSTRDAIPAASVLTRMECRVKPMRDGRTGLLDDFEAFFQSLPGGLLDLKAAVFDKAAKLRASLNLRTPDALHLATALVHGCDVFLTNDTALTRCTEIQVELLKPTF
jgi:predicted nucleic acid-binding protein